MPMTIRTEQLLKRREGILRHMQLWPNDKFLSRLELEAELKKIDNELSLKKPAAVKGRKIKPIVVNRVSVKRPVQPTFQKHWKPATLKQFGGNAPQQPQIVSKVFCPGELRLAPNRYYFAYGSNLNVTSMERRCSGAKQLKKLRLCGYRLVFRGVADIECTGNPDDFVEGGLWKINSSDEANLDRYEGVSFVNPRYGSYRKVLFPISHEGKTIDIMTYQMNDKGIGPPTELYFNTIVQGYRDFNLDLSALDAALQRSWDERRESDRLKDRYGRTHALLMKPIPLEDYAKFTPAKKEEEPADDEAAGTLLDAVDPLVDDTPTEDSEAFIEPTYTEHNFTEKEKL